MDTAGLSGLAALSSSSQTLQATNASSAAAASSTASGTSSSSQSVFYASPIMSFDTVTGALIWEYRDTTTGAFEDQSPSRATLLYEQSQQLTGSQGASSKASQSSTGQSVSIYG